MIRELFAALVFVSISISAVRASEEPPKEWIDPDTGHRVIRLSTEPGSQSLYFHQYSYTPDGRKLVFSTPTGICMVNLATREIERIVEGKDLRLIMVGRKTGDAYYSKERSVSAANVATKATREIATLPEGGSIATVNADESLLAGTITENLPATMPSGPDGQPMTKGQRISWRFNLKLPMSLIFVDTKSGEIVRKVNRCNDWLNHLQFSPTDPNLLMFCHEGPWEKVDRIWTIRSDGTGLTKVHTRRMEREIAGHEFFGADGKTLWYDLQTPRGEDFWVAGLDVASGQRTWHHLQRDEWSVHFNVSPDGTLFAGDGGSEGMVARAKDGKWIYLFRPEPIRDTGTLVGEKPLIRCNVFRSERLVNMSKHDYALEPNVTFTPDMKWLVFRSNMHGPSHVYAVEIARASQ